LLLDTNNTFDISHPIFCKIVDLNIRKYNFRHIYINILHFYWKNNFLAQQDLMDYLKNKLDKNCVELYEIIK